MTDLQAPAISYADVRDSVAVARSHGEKFFEQIVWQVENEAWTILGYGSWDEMRDAEYGDLGVVAPRADRPELVSRLKARGLPNTTIADTLGVAEATVRNVIRNSAIDSPSTITNARGQRRPATYQRQLTSEALPPFDPRTGEVLDQPSALSDEPGRIVKLTGLGSVSSPAPAAPGADGYAPGAYPSPKPVTGLDGKTYTRPAPAAEPKARRRPLPDAFFDAAYNLRKQVERLTRLVEDDRFPANREQVALRHENDLLQTAEALAGVLRALTNNQSGV